MLDALVLVAQRERHPHVPARLLDRRAGISLAVGHVDGALDTDPERLRGLELADQAIEEPAELGHPLDGHAEAAREHVEAAAHRRFHRLRALRRDPDRGTRLLERLREHHGLRDLEELAVVAEGPALERLQEDVDRLLPPRAAALELEAEALELVRLVAAPQADVETST